LTSKTLFEQLERPLTREQRRQLNDNINAVTRIIDREFPEQTIPVKANIREASTSIIK
jgi:hypothetical protein